MLFRSAGPRRPGRTHGGLTMSATPGTGGTVGIVANPVSGAGLAFRCRNLRNCWFLEAVPEYGTWNVVRTVDGRRTKVANLGVVPIAPGTLVSVAMTPARLTFFVNGAEVRRVDDPALGGDRAVGLDAAHFGLIEEKLLTGPAKRDGFVVPGVQPAVAHRGIEGNLERVFREIDIVGKAAIVHVRANVALFIFHRYMNGSLSFIFP